MAIKVEWVRNIGLSNRFHQNNFIISIRKRLPLRKTLAMRDTSLPMSVCLIKDISFRFPIVLLYDFIFLDNIQLFKGKGSIGIIKGIFTNPVILFDEGRLFKTPLSIARGLPSSS